MVTQLKGFMLWASVIKVKPCKLDYYQIFDVGYKGPIEVGCYNSNLNRLELYIAIGIYDLYLLDIRNI